ncbi:hypothetical protein FGB62_63g117 [Gracilaria domingensis]|nr:hypothetical protein FGB62_63g117 [Gracilaria domingensis]
MQENGDLNVPITMENILNALSILHRGDQRVSQADRFLAQARASPQVWHVLPALLNSRLQPQLLFASQALCTRIRADWLVMDNNARSNAVSLAAEALFNSTLARQSQATRSSRVYDFGKTLGCAVSRSPMDFQEPVWEMLILKLRNKPALECGTMAAIATEMNQNATSHVANYVQIRAFCRSKAHQVVPDAVFMLASCRRNGALSEEQMEQLKDAIQCLQDWTPYADKMQIANALLEVITIPKLAQSATEALHDSGPDAHVIHHGVSEVVCSLSEWNADELMEQQTEQSDEVIRNVIDLLWTCLNAPDKPSFFAAIEGWMEWVPVDHLMQEDQAWLESERVCAVLSVVIKRMESLSFIHNHFSPDLDDFESEDEKSSVLELLATGALSVGHQKYLDLDFVEDARINEKEWDSLHQVLDSVLRLGEVRSGDVLSDTSEGSLHWRTVVQNSAPSALASHGLLVRKDEKLFYRTAVCAVNALQRRDLADRGAALLQSLSEIQAHSLLPFLRDLITALNRSVSSFSTSAAENVTDTVASVASLLRLRQERVNALEEMMRKPCERLRVAAVGRAEASLNESVLCRDLTLLNAAMGIKEPLFLLAWRHCGNGIISEAICNLINAVPALFDEEDEASGDRVFDRYEKSRLQSIVATTKLLGDCFKHSGSVGECVWLETMNKLIPDLVTGVEDLFGSCNVGALYCVTESPLCEVLGPNTFSGVNYDTKPEITRMLLKLLRTVTSRASGTLLPVAQEISRAALSTLQCSNVVIVTESLHFWKALFSRRAGAPLQQTILSVASGTNGVSAEALCAAQISRCAHDIADVLFATCRIISGELDENTELGDCLKSAFVGDRVPREGLDRNVKEMLFQGCYNFAANRKEFRQAQ